MLQAAVTLNLVLLVTFPEASIFTNSFLVVVVCKNEDFSPTKNKSGIQICFPSS